MAVVDRETLHVEPDRLEPLCVLLSVKVGVEAVPEEVVLLLTDEIEDRLSKRLLVAGKSVREVLLEKVRCMESATVSSRSVVLWADAADLLGMPEVSR